MNTDNNNKLKIEASNRVNELIKKHISKLPIIGLIDVNGEEIKGKYLEDIDLIVRVNINIHKVGLFNRDICRVIGETIDEKIIVKKLEDDHVGIVEKRQVDLPMWLEYDL